MKEKNAFWISTLYLLLGILWIYWSDRAIILVLNLESVNDLTKVQSYKGIGFILFTTLLLFLLIRNATYRLRASESFYKSYFEQNPNPMWLISSKDEQILAVNEAAVRVYGYTREEFLHMLISDICPEKNLGIHTEPAGNSQAGINTIGSVHFYKKNSDFLYVDIYTFHTTSKQKKVAFIMAIDINQRVKFEEEVTELTRTLEVKVNERTRQYMDKNYELEKANRVLISLNEELAAANDVISQQADLLVKQSEDKLNTILHTIQDVVWSSTFTNRELNFINQAAKQVFGYSPEELYQNGRILENIVYSEDKKQVEGAFKELISRGYIQAEYRILHRSGEVRWIRNRVWLKRNTSGQPVVMDGVITDITERKQYEAELQKPQLLLSSLIASQTNYLIRTDLEGKFIFANQQFLKEFGFLPEEITGKQINQLLTPEDGEAFQNMTCECMQQPGKIVPLQICTADKNRQVSWTEWEFIGLQNEKGQVLEIQGVGHNITERKKSEVQLEENARTLQEAQQVAQIGNWAYDPATKVVTWSDQVFAIHRLNKEYGPPGLEQLSALFHSDDWAILLKAFNTAIERAVAYNLDLRILDPVSREIIYVNLIGKPETDKTGKVVKLYGTILNINERKLFEKNLQRQNEQLRKINAELDKFVYSVSHSLRAPLTSVLGLVNVIRIGEVDAQTNLYLGLIEKSILKLDETIHEINNYSRNARLGLNIAEVDLPKILQELKEQYAAASGADKVNVDIVLQAAYPFYSDTERLRVVLNNLLSNAFKYRDEKKPDPYIIVRVNVTKESATIEVEDNGIGIDPDYTDKIFNMFFRASERSTGSGLGLYIVKEMVDKLKGTVSVASQLGKGSTFSIWLANIHD